MADSLTQGKSWLFYVYAGGAPASFPDEVTSYTKVGLLINESGSTTSDTVDARHKDSGGYRLVIPTTLGSEITLNGYLPIDTNAGHTILYNAANATALASKTIGWISSSNVTAEYQERGTAYVLGYDWEKEVDGVATWTVNLSVINGITREAVD